MRGRTGEWCGFRGRLRGRDRRCVNNADVAYHGNGAILGSRVLGKATNRGHSFLGAFLAGVVPGPCGVPPFATIATFPAEARWPLNPFRISVPLRLFLVALLSKGGELAQKAMAQDPRNVSRRTDVVTV